MPTSMPVQQPAQQVKQESKDDDDDDDDRRDPFKESKFSKLKRFLRECRRVLKVLRKPGKEEFLTTAKVSALGLAIIGFIGFALSMVQQLVLK